MLEIVVVRHGQSQADLENRFEGRADFPLTELGIKQAKCLAQWIYSHYKPERIITSPLQRAKSTAKIISDYCKVELVEDPLLMEWDNGLLAGLTREEGNRLFPLPAKGRRPYDTFANSESYIAFRARIEHFWSKFIDTYDNESQFRRICIVTHGGMINMLFRVFLNLPMNTEVTLRTGDTGIHLWQVDGQKRSVIFSNKQEHLLDL